jgi:hypothetical protein
LHLIYRAHLNLEVTICGMIQPWWMRPAWRSLPAVIGSGGLGFHPAAWPVDLVLRWNRPNDKNLDMQLPESFTRFSILNSFLV